MAAVSNGHHDQGARPGSQPIFKALEERVLRAVELLNAEREAPRAAAQRRSKSLSGTSAELDANLASLAEHSNAAGRRNWQLQQERTTYAARRALLKHLDEFTA